jgi:hypothetical protein
VGEHFIQIQCPSCASTEVELVNQQQTYRCRHCSSTFVFRDPRPQAPQIAAPPPQSAWGPQHQAAQPVYVAVHTPSAGRWIAWVIVMLVVFGGSGISAFIAFFNAATTTATSPTATPTVQPTKPVPKSAAALPHTSKPAIAAETKPTPTPSAEEPAKPEVAAIPEIDLQQYQALSGCGCRADVERDGRKDQIDLYLRAGASTVISPTGTDNFVNTTFAVAGEGLKPFDLPATEETAPATKYNAGRIGIGVGCENDTLVIAALDKVSAWSLSKREVMWTKPLSPAFSRFAEGKASVNCSAITVNGGVAHVRTEGGMKQFRIDTGDDATASRPSSSSSSPSKSPSPTKTEPAKPEPIKPVPSKTEPSKTDATKKKQSKPPIPPVPPPDDKKKGKKGKRAAK